MLRKTLGRGLLSGLQWVWLRLGSGILWMGAKIKTLFSTLRLRVSPLSKLVLKTSANKSSDSRSNPMSDETSSKDEYQDSNNASVISNGTNSPVLVAKVGAHDSQRSGKDLLLSMVMALSIMVNVVVSMLYMSSQREVTDAYKDIKTQVWVRQDKDEERFQKFVAGPYAELAGNIKANQLLLAMCKESKQ